MKGRKFVIASILLMIGIVGAIAVLLLCTSFSAKALPPNLPDAFKSVPSDCQFVLGINVPRLVASSFYSKILQERQTAGQIGSNLAAFIEQTGVDPARDISYLVMAAHSGEKTKPEGLVIVAGNFDRNKITGYIRSKASPSELEYGGVSVLMLPEQKVNGTKSGIAFLSGHEIALGDLESLKAAVDTRAGGKKNILSNAGMVSLLNGIDFNEMFWFAGDAASVLRRSPLPAPVGPNALSMQSIVGTFNIADNVVGKITATAVDSDSAAKLADVIRGLKAFGQLSEDQNPDLKLLLNGVTVTQNAAQVSLSLNIPGDLIKKLGRAKSMPKASAK